MTMPMNLDELLALEEKRDAERLRWAEADAAFRKDVGLVIEIAKASAKAHEKHQRKLAEREAEKVQDAVDAAAPIANIRAAETVESPDEKRRRLARESMRRARARERAARASEAAGQREAALGTCRGVRGLQRPLRLRAEEAVSITYEGSY